jgi:hypothetical protein
MRDIADRFAMFCWGGGRPSQPTASFPGERIEFGRWSRLVTGLTGA